MTNPDEVACRHYREPQCYACGEPVCVYCGSDQISRALQAERAGWKGRLAKWFAVKAGIMPDHKHDYVFAICDPCNTRIGATLNKPPVKAPTEGAERRRSNPGENTPP